MGRFKIWGWHELTQRHCAAWAELCPSISWLAGEKFRVGQGLVLFLFGLWGNPWRTAQGKLCCPTDGCGCRGAQVWFSCGLSHWPAKVTEPPWASHLQTRRVKRRHVLRYSSNSEFMFKARRRSCRGRIGVNKNVIMKPWVQTIPVPQKNKNQFWQQYGKLAFLTYSQGESTQAF